MSDMAPALDSPLASLPIVTIELPLKGDNLICMCGLNMTRTVTLICVLTESIHLRSEVRRTPENDNQVQGRPVKSTFDSHGDKGVFVDLTFHIRGYILIGMISP